MAVRCCACGKEFESKLVSAEQWILCDCGVPVALDAPRFPKFEPGRQKMRELARLADVLCCHILDENYAAVDIAVERSQLREKALEWFPECEELFEMVYESRFDRLWEQWRVH